MRDAFESSGLFVKDIAARSGVNKRTIDDWVGGRAKVARSNDLYAVCKAVGITMEQAVDGEAGKEYVRNWVFNEAKVYRPPLRIADIVSDLLEMDDKSLAIIRGTIGGIVEGEKGTRTGEIVA